MEKGQFVLVSREASPERRTKRTKGRVVGYPGKENACLLTAYCPDLGKKEAAASMREPMVAWPLQGAASTNQRLNAKEVWINVISRHLRVKWHSRTVAKWLHPDSDTPAPVPAEVSAVYAVLLVGTT